MILVWLACARVDDGARGCDAARSADAQELCEACAPGGACRGVLEEEDGVALRCSGEARTASLVWALDHEDDCEELDPAEPPGCPVREPVPFAPGAQRVDPVESFGGHLEREASLAIDPAGIPLESVASAVHVAVHAALPKLERWATPRLVGDLTGIDPHSVYLLTEELLGECCTETTMVDVYLDHQQVLLEGRWGYRFRQRFGNPLDELAFEAAMATGRLPDEGNQPNEMQFQSGEFVTVDEAGVTRVRERTLWFSPGYPPFEEGESYESCLEDEGCELGLPPRPWGPQDWVPAMQSGVVSLDGRVFVPLPSDAVAGGLEPVGAAPIHLEPVVVTVSTRRRFEVLLRYPGAVGSSGRCPPDEIDCPDEDQEESFLVSIDQTDVLPGVPWMEFVSGRTGPRRPSVLATFREVEIELQSDTIDPLENLERDGDRAAGRVLDALEQDHWTLIGVVRDALLELGVHPVPAERSKYQRAAAEAEMVRGDVDRSGGVDGADAVALAQALDGTRAVGPSADLDLDGDHTGADLRYLLAYLYLDGPEPPPPFPEPAVPCL